MLRVVGVGDKVNLQAIASNATFTPGSETSVQTSTFNKKSK